jgi:hypothetical protein
MMVVGQLMAAPYVCSCQTLMDPQKRREYDSTDDFDDTLPSDCTQADFFKVRGSFSFYVLGVFMSARA